MFDHGEGEEGAVVEADVDVEAADFVGGEGCEWSSMMGCGD